MPYGLVKTRSTYTARRAITSGLVKTRPDVIALLYATLFQFLRSNPHRQIYHIVSMIISSLLLSTDQLSDNMSIFADAFPVIGNRFYRGGSSAATHHAFLLDSTGRMASAALSASVILPERKVHIGREGCSSQDTGIVQ